MTQEAKCHYSYESRPGQKPTPIEKQAYLRVLNRLLSSEEASVRYKALVGLSGKAPTDEECIALKEQIRSSPRVETLLSERDETGMVPVHPYKKWYGAHWILAMLAELEYPAGDNSLVSLREQVYKWLFSSAHERSIVSIDGRTRRCSSQEGYALYYLLRLGLDDDRVDELARRLIEWQWPDGGWNCDKRPEATHSSFMESLLPMRALDYMHSQEVTTKRLLRSKELRMFSSEENCSNVKMTVRLSIQIS